MPAPVLLSAILLAFAETSVMTVSPDSPFYLEEAHTTFEDARGQISEDADAFEVIGCVAVWRAWDTLSKDAKVPARLLARMPELGQPNASRMQAAWQRRLQVILETDTLNADIYRQDLADRYNFELTEARDVLGGAHIQPELVFKAAGACQPI